MLLFFFLLTPLDINSELDELDREEFYRLKKVQDKKQRDYEIAETARKAKKEAELLALVDEAIAAGNSPEEASKIAEAKEEAKEKQAAAAGLSESDDDDVVF